MDQVAVSRLKGHEWLETLGSSDLALATLIQDGTVPEAVLRVMAEIEHANLGITEDLPLTTRFGFSLVE